MAAQRITFYKFIPLEDFDANKTIENLQNKNTSENYFIFSEQGDLFIRGCYYHDHPYTSPRYNVLTGEIEKMTIIKQHTVKFEIDLQDQTLMLWGGKKFTNELLTEISLASNGSVSIEEEIINFKKTISKITKDGNIRITKLKIANVPIEKGILATCTISVDNIESQDAFVKRYAEKTMQLSISIFDNSIDAEISNRTCATLYSSGSFVVHKDRDSMSDETIDVLKRIII